MTEPPDQIEASDVDKPKWYIGMSRRRRLAMGMGGLIAAALSTFAIYTSFLSPEARYHRSMCSTMDDALLQFSDLAGDRFIAAVNYDSNFGPLRAELSEGLRGWSPNLEVVQPPEDLSYEHEVFVDTFLEAIEDSDYEEDLEEAASDLDNFGCEDTTSEFIDLA